MLSGVNYNFTFSYSLCINLVPGVSLYLNEEDNHSAEEPDKDSTNTNSTYKHIQTKNFNNEADLNKAIDEFFFKNRPLIRNNKRLASCIEEHKLLNRYLSCNCKASCNLKYRLATCVNCLQMSVYCNEDEDGHVQVVQVNNKRKGITLQAKTAIDKMDIYFDKMI